jgi:hypothetical protein
VLTSIIENAAEIEVVWKECCASLFESAIKRTMDETRIACTILTDRAKRHHRHSGFNPYLRQIQVVESSKVCRSADNN